MSSTSRPVVYSLLTVILVLLLGMITLLSVAYQRHRHLDDLRIDLQRNFYQQESQIRDLKVRLEDCDTVRTNGPIDTPGGTLPVTDSVRVPGRVKPPGSR